MNVKVRILVKDLEQSYKFFISPSAKTQIPPVGCNFTQNVH